jgi:hypothetical protein
MATTMIAPEIDPHTPYLTFTSVSGETVILDTFLSAAIGRWVRHQIATDGSETFRLNKPLTELFFNQPAILHIRRALRSIDFTAAGNSIMSE